MNFVSILRTGMGSVLYMLYKLRGGREAYHRKTNDLLAEAGGKEAGRQQQHMSATLCANNLDARDSWGYALLCMLAETARRVSSVSALITAVFIHSSCYDVIPQTGQLINNSNLFLIVLEAVKPKAEVLAGSGYGEGLPPGSQIAIFSLLLTCVFTKGMGSLQGLFYMDTNFIYEDSALLT